jgi:hypothetical protein
MVQMKEGSATLSSAKSSQRSCLLLENSKQALMPEEPNLSTRDSGRHTKRLKEMLTQVIEHVAAT